MPKVREVLERIGDQPLIEALKARGYNVFAQTWAGEEEMADDLREGGWGVFGEDDYDALVKYARTQGVPVMDEDVNVQEGFRLYRMRNTEEFRLWLRNFFWQQLGRIV